MVLLFFGIFWLDIIYISVSEPLAEHWICWKVGLFAKATIEVELSHCIYQS